MSKFVHFKATGVILKRNKDGQPTGIQETRFGSGVVKPGRELYGSVFKQCPQLLRCDSISVKTYPI